MTTPTTNKSYLGDGVYVDIDDGGYLVLTVEDGIRTINTIFLDPAVYGALLLYVARRIEVAKHLEEG